MPVTVSSCGQGSTIFQRCTRLDLVRLGGQPAVAAESSPSPYRESRTLDLMSLSARDLDAEVKALSYRPGEAEAGTRHAADHRHDADTSVKADIDAVDDDALIALRMRAFFALCSST